MYAHACRMPLIKHTTIWYVLFTHWWTSLMIDSVSLSLLPAVTGHCKHCFHMHCIMKWLSAQQMQQHCPMSRQEWKFSD